MPPAKRGRPKAMFGTEAPTIQALDRALDVMQFLSDQSSATLTGIATGLDQSVATIHRVLATLESRQFVEMSAEGQEWYVGPAAFRIGSTFLRRTNVVERARPIMRALTERSGETSNLGVEWQGRVMFLSQVETHEMIRAFFPPGTISAMHASGIGKALLAAQGADRLAALLATPLERFTPRTLTTPEDLQMALAQTRAQGFAVDDEERTPGMRCVAAPILNMHGEAVAGISVSGPVQRLPDARIAQIGEMVREAAAEVGRQIGAPLAAARGM